jgi:hypothetical protein
VRELRTPGSVRGVSSNGYLYRDNRPITSIRTDLISNPRMQTDSRIKLWVVWVEVVETGLRGFDIPVSR